MMIGLIVRSYASHYPYPCAARKLANFHALGSSRAEAAEVRNVILGSKLSKHTGENVRASNVKEGLLSERDLGGIASSLRAARRGAKEKEGLPVRDGGLEECKKSSARFRT